MSAIAVDPTPAPPPPAQASIRPGLVLAGRNAKLIMVPRSLFSMVIYPIIFFVAFSIVLRRLLESQGIDVDQHLPPTIIVQSMMFAAMASAFFLSTDVQSGMINRLRSMPIGRAAVPIGRLAADAIRCIISITVITLAGYVVGFRFEGGIAAAVLFFVIAIAFALALGAGASSIGLGIPDPGGVFAVLTLPYLPLFSLSTAFVAAEDFPGWLEPIVRNSPVSATIDALRSLATDGVIWSEIEAAVFWIIGLSIVFGALFARAFRRVS